MYYPIHATVMYLVLIRTVVLSVQMYVPWAERTKSGHIHTHITSSIINQDSRTPDTGLARIGRIPADHNQNQIHARKRGVIKSIPRITTTTSTTTSSQWFAPNFLFLPSSPSLASPPPSSRQRNPTRFNPRWPMPSPRVLSPPPSTMDWITPISHLT